MENDDDGNDEDNDNEMKGIKVMLLICSQSNSFCKDDDNLQKKAANYCN